MQSNIDPCETMRNNLIAAALGLQQCTKTAAGLVPLSDGRVIAIGTPAAVERLLATQAQAAAPATDERDGWMVDGSLIYRLNEEGSNRDEINITMVDCSRDPAVRHDAAVELLTELMSDAAAVEPKKDEELLSLHRRLAAEVLHAEQGWARAEAKSKECIELRERFAAQVEPVAIPAGWKLVPVEPTEEMIQAGCLNQASLDTFATYEDWWNNHTSGISEKIRGYVSSDYRAMLAAAPSPAAEGGATSELPEVWMSEHELRQMRRILSVAGVGAVEDLDANSAMPAFWSLIGQIAGMLESAGAAPSEQLAAPIGTPRVDVLMSKWDDDGATRGSAFIELRDLARELERAAAPAGKAAAEPVISSYDLEKVKSLKYKFVDSLIHSGVQYRTCGAISATLNRIIDASEAASQANGGE